MSEAIKETKYIAVKTVELIAERWLTMIHGKKSIDYVLGYQKACKDIIEACEKAREL
jgi:hypothetical protein